MKAILFKVTPNVVKRFAYMERKLQVMKLPKLEPPFRVYLYEEKKTKDNEERYDDGDEIFRQKWWEHYDKVVGSGICWSKFYDGYGFGNMILTDFVFYDKPKELSEFNRPCSYAGLCFSCGRAKFTSKGDRVCEAIITRPPQSWCYVEE